MMDNFGYANMMGFSLGGIIMWVFFIVFIVVIAMAMRTCSSTSCSGIFGDKSVDILKKRYAKGEISKEEFDKIKKDLE